MQPRDNNSNVLSVPCSIANSCIRKLNKYIQKHLEIPNAGRAKWLGAAEKGKKNVQKWKN